MRSIGPGGYHPSESRYSYLDQTGTFRFEANVEYRFRIFKSIWGATFLDAGNVWLMRKDEARPNSQLELKTFPKQIALGTGVGIRYDMDILVFRLDFGIPLQFALRYRKKWILQCHRNLYEESGNTFCYRLSLLMNDFCTILVNND